jgi:hypothetical protein
MSTPEMDVNAALGELRRLVCWLGAGLLVLSLAVNVYVFKQNRNLSALVDARRAQVNQLEAVQRQWLPVVNDLVQYSQGRPDLQAVLKQCGISLQQPAK